MTEFSYNGWPVVDQSAIVPLIVAGVSFPGGVLGGDVRTVMYDFALWYHNTIEPLISGDCWGYEVRADTNDPNLISCHASGTAIDLNAPNHPNGGSQYAGFTVGQVNAINQKIADVGCLYWGANFTGTHDPMHVEIQGDAAAVHEAALRVGPLTPKPTPPTEDEEMTLDVVRDDRNWDYAFNAATGVFIFITSEDHYFFLYAAGIITVPHGEARHVEDNLLGFIRSECARAAGVGGDKKRIDDIPPKA